MTDSYTPSNSAIIHKVKVDFANTNNVSYEKVILMQYDKTLPLLKVELFNNGERYAVPSGYACNLRMKKVDGTVVYKEATGISTDRKTLYFEVDYQMTYFSGDFAVIVELSSSTNNEVESRLGSSFIYLKVNSNPIQQGDPSRTESDFAKVAFTGDYNDLINAPGGGGGSAVPTVFSVAYNLVTNMYGKFIQGQNFGPEITDESGTYRVFRNVNNQPITDEATQKAYFKRMTGNECIPVYDSMVPAQCYLYLTSSDEHWKLQKTGNQIRAYKVINFPYVTKGELDDYLTFEDVVIDDWEE